MIIPHGLVSLASGVLSELFSNVIGSRSTLSKRKESHGEFIAFAVLIPVLVILSGIFAGLTLGYMSLDETQLNVLSVSGTPKQREYANKIKPIRKNGHLLLVTLLLANMIVNETLPVISDPVLGGGVPSVVVSTVLIVVFAEIIPQSICTRHGLYIGAKMAGPTQILIYCFGIGAWPIAKLLEFLLGPHHGIIYRRTELKELIALHAEMSPHGGDLRPDTVTIIGATLDLQEKVVRQAMTPIEKVFMLHIDAKLDYDTLRTICRTGHSRIPVYEEVEINLPSSDTNGQSSKGGDSLSKQTVKKIIGNLLVKQCVLLDPEDAVPVRKMRLNKVPFVPQNEPLLGILDRFQEGRTHMAIVSRMSVERARSMKKAVKKGLTQRLLDTVMGDSSSDSEESDDESKTARDDSSIKKVSTNASDDTAAPKRGRKKRFRNRKRKADLEEGDAKVEEHKLKTLLKNSSLEQNTPADAILTKEGAEEYIQSQGLDPAIMPLGIITLEDVLEELIGEEIYDEFDTDGDGLHTQNFIPPGVPVVQPKPITLVKKSSAPELAPSKEERIIEPNHAWSSSLGLSGLAVPLTMPPSLRNLGFLRSRSAPPTPRDKVAPLPSEQPSGSTPSPIDEKVHPADLSEEPIPIVHTLESPAVSGQVSKAPSVKFVPEVEENNEVSEEAPADTKAKANAPGTISLPSGPPALEAILLDRKRRGHTGQGAPTPMSPGTPIVPPLGAVRAKVGGTPSIKGKSFKSSPLVPNSVDPELINYSTTKRNRSKDASNFSSSQNDGEGGISIRGPAERTGPDIAETKEDNE